VTTLVKYVTNFVLEKTNLDYTNTHTVTNQNTQCQR